jgi:hypothetical protein
VTEHPLFRMWKDRRDAEIARELERTVRRGEREREYARWLAAWVEYKARRTRSHPPAPKPRWWDLPGWGRWLFNLHAPGGRN